MLDCLAALHYPHNCRLSFEVSISRYPLVGRLVLFLGLLELDLIDLNPHLGIGETCVIRKFICLIHVFTFRILGKNPVFGTGKGL